MESRGEGNRWEQVSTSQRTRGRGENGFFEASESFPLQQALLHRLVLRVPKATLDILGAYWAAPFRAIFGLELDCGKP